MLKFHLGYAGIPATGPYSYSETRPYLDNKPPSPHSVPGTLSQGQHSTFACNNPVITQQMFPNYPIMQPDRSMAIQPTTSREGMIYPGPVLSQGYPEQPVLQSSSPISPSNHTARVEAFPASSSEGTEGPRRQYNIAHTLVHPEADRVHVPGPSRDLDIVQQQPHQRPPPSRRGPFRNQNDRERTAETRRIGSCIRCRMQRIRVSR
jgi:hypothetical protein